MARRLKKLHSEIYSCSFERSDSSICVNSLSGDASSNLSIWIADAVFNVKDFVLRAIVSNDNSFINSGGARASLGVCGASTNECCLLGLLKNGLTNLVILVNLDFFFGIEKLGESSNTPYALFVEVKDLLHHPLHVVTIVVVFLVDFVLVFILV